jgi:uncharacterized membrane protein YkvA (DUF1232 family)
VLWWEWLLVSLAVLLLGYAAFVGWLVARGRREDARALASFIPDCIVLVSCMAREPRVPRRRKLLLLGLVAYLALPFDLVPDFIPVAGQLDDVIIVALVLRHFVAAGGEPLIRELCDEDDVDEDGVLFSARRRPPPTDGRRRDRTRAIAGLSWPQDAQTGTTQAYEVVAYYPVNGGRAAFTAQILTRRLKATGGLPVPRWKVIRTASR